MKRFSGCTPRYEKTLKNHPLEVAKKCVETYSPSNAVAPDPEEGVQRQKKIPFRHILNYTTLSALCKQS